MQTIEETLTSIPAIQNITLDQIIAEACQRIAPLWSLENFVAVNPYLGNVDKKFSIVAQELSYLANIDSTMPINFYLDKIEKKEIVLQDVEKALQSSKANQYKNAEIFLENLCRSSSKKSVLPSIATAMQLVSQTTNVEWERFAIQRISLWCASYFDNGQAQLSSLTKNKNLFTSWKREALIDKTPEIAGLKSFRKQLQNLPDQPTETIEYVLNEFGLKSTAASYYLQRLLLSLNGWAGFAARIDYDAKLDSKESNQVTQLLAVLVSWELCTYLSLKNENLEDKWKQNKLNLASIKEEAIIDGTVANTILLQEAFNFSEQRKIISVINATKTTVETEKEKEVQAIFCIDVRSEIFRRNLEKTDSKIQTFGFAGFFGFPVNLLPLGKDKTKAQTPVLIKPQLTVFEKIRENNTNNKTVKRLKIKQEIASLWKTFKSGAVSCFVFVSPLGLLYIPKLIFETFKLSHFAKGFFSGRSRKLTVISLQDNSKIQTNLGISLDTQVEMAKNALTAMSLTENFGKLVLLVGHGASTTNNPYGSALHCGACGGHTGEANAKVAASIFNNQYVRSQLKKSNINIPESTVFVACLHNTTTDQISIFNEDDLSSSHEQLFKSLKTNLQTATGVTRTERAIRMSTENKNVTQRSRDWSQVRPEWGLAGCSAFLIGKQQRTKNLNLNGKVFLHTYDCEKDTENKILQAIMTAPMVVTSWISLQYYASTVDNKKLGSGNKTLHNITAGIGVIEGFSGDLRTGLPMQSISDGNYLQHNPTILNVIIEAKIESLNQVIEQNKLVRNLVDNGWLKLLQMNEDGKISNRYTGNLNWETI
ncbi:YbcC family protein [Flavobacterium sp. TMP13]|uniref:YbcC family protein n=1 Tax=Flavobacterium sp. TMP13 TaxID=3425950 RepID=UPI003D7878F6